MLREIVSNEWYTLFIMLGLVFITLAKHIFAHRFSDFIEVIGNSKYLKLYVKEQKYIDGFNTLLLLNLIISAAIFTNIILSTFNNDWSFNLILFLQLLVVIGAILVLKSGIERILGRLFEIEPLIDAYLFQKTSFKNYSGMLLIPINALLLFSVTPSKPTIYFIIGFIIIINLIGFITSVRNYQKLIISNFFYFILYLCTLEIGPYLILYKLIIENEA